MKKILSSRRWLPLAALSFAAALLAGCSIAKPYPAARQTFLLEAPRRAAAMPASTNQVSLQLHVFRVAPPFDGQSFVYRRSGLNYETDFYNQFLAAPGNLINNQTRQWLTDAALVQTVLVPGTKAAATHGLEGNVTELFADLSNAKSPQAVLAIQFLVTDERRANAAIVFQKSYRQAVALKQRTPEAIAEAWSAALAAILQDLEHDLRAVQWR